MRKQVMIMAHNVAKNTVEKVGDYMIALSIGMKISKITGVSEKQIKYAEDLIKISIDTLGASQEKYEEMM